MPLQPQKQPTTEEKKYNAEQLTRLPSFATYDKATRHYDLLFLLFSSKSLGCFVVFNIVSGIKKN